MGATIDRRTAADRRIYSGGMAGGRRRALKSSHRTGARTTSRVTKDYDRIYVSLYIYVYINSPATETDNRWASHNLTDMSTHTVADKGKKKKKYKKKYMQLKNIETEKLNMNFLSVEQARKNQQIKREAGQRMNDN